MNYTQNYHLPQWVKEDRIMMEDFNAMNSSIESGLTATAGTAAEAKATAAQAEQVANTASTKADLLPYVVGTYVGTGQDLPIDVGFRPSFLIVSGVRDFSGAPSYNDFTQYAAVTAGNSVIHRITFTDTGFVLRGTGSGSFVYPDLTYVGRSYDYIAFR